MSSERIPRVVPRWPILLLLLAIVFAVAWLQVGDGFGDRGMNNAISYMAAVLFGSIYGLWFVLGSGQSGRVRLAGLALGVVGLAGAVLAVRVDSWTGAMIPDLRWAWEGPRDSQLATDAIEAQGDLDLVTTGEADFPGFLGPTRTAAVPGVVLARDWSEAPPKLEWRVPCGSGWSGFAVVHEIALTLEQRRGQQVAVARSMADGSEVWRFARDGTYFSQLAGDGPRSTPLVHEGLVYTHDALGWLTCLDGRDGSLVWERDLRAMYGMTDELESELIAFGRSPSPIVYDGRLIIAAGGDPNGKRAGLVAFEARTGELLWEGPPRQLSHASPNVVTLAGRTQIVVTNEDTVSGHAPESGELLWEHPWEGTTGQSANNSQPTPVGDDRVLMSKGYGQGSALIRLERAEDGALTVQPVWASRRSLRTKFTNPVVHEGHAYALSDGILECVSLETGRRVWRDGRYGHGQVLLTGEGDAAVLLVLSEEGDLVMVTPRPDVENEVLGTLEALSDKTWNTFALYGDRVVVRNAIEAACYRLPLAGE